MKKIQVIALSSIAVMSLVACGGNTEPVPDNTSFWEDNGVNGGSDTADQTSFWDQNASSNNNGGSYWDQYETTDSGESYWDQNTSSDAGSGEIILPQEYYVCLVGHEWARSVDGGSCEDYVLEFDEEGYWKAFEYYNFNWNEVDYGYVDFDYDGEQYILFSEKYDIKFDICTYDSTVLYGALCNYHQDAQTPATAGNYDMEDSDPVYTNEDYNIYFSNYDGEWRVIDPNSDTESDSYYEISNGMWSYFYYDGFDWVLGSTGRLELEDGRTDSVLFYTDDGTYLFGAWEFDTGILKCSDEAGSTLERY